MGQVPASVYYIVGDGRVARHLRRYFDLEALPHYTYSRKNSSSFAVPQDVTHLLLAISDRAIASFYDERPELQNFRCVHFSGALTHPRVESAHPLMTFANDRFYSLDEYRAIPFVTEKGRATFAQLFPALKNPSYAITSSEKPLYHAICTMAGNFTVLLWEKAFAEFQAMGLPREVLTPYLQRTTANLTEASDSVLTGPLVRGDREVIEKHLAELKDDPYRAVYEAFVAAYERRTT